MKKYSLLILLTLFLTSCNPKSGSWRQLYTHYPNYESFKNHIESRAARGGKVYKVIDVNYGELASYTTDNYLFGVGSRWDYYAYDEIDYTLDPSDGCTFFHKDNVVFALTYHFYNTKSLEGLSILDNHGKYSTFPCMGISYHTSHPEAFDKMEGRYYTYYIVNELKVNVATIIFNETIPLENRDYYSSLILNAFKA